MSYKHKKDEDSGALAAVAVVAAVGVLIYGAMDYFLNKPAVTVEQPEKVVIKDSSASMWSRQQQNRLSDELTCKICEHRKITHALPCGHTMCGDCAMKVCSSSIKLCPFDRSPIEGVPKKIYL